MTAVVEVRYVALKPLPVEIDGERAVLNPGDEIPAECLGAWVDTSIEAGKIAPLLALTDEEFKLEATARGYRLTPLKAAKAA